MTINDAIAKTDELHPNAYSRSDKIKWLSDVDHVVYNEIIKTHHDDESETEFSGYDDSTPGTTELLIGAPYEDAYISFLEAKIDYYNGEINRYNNAILAYNDQFGEFANAYNRSHKPKGFRRKFF